MDIERMKRVNLLARELKDHGMASDYDEAYRQAETMVDSGMGMPTANSEVPAAPAPSTTIIKDEPKEDKGGFGMMGFDALEFRNMKEKMDAMEQQMGMIFTKMNEIITELNRVDKKRADSPIEVRNPREVEEKQREMQTNLKNQEVAAPHPRSGDYKPNDVSIEKMFYFGGSR